MAYVQSFFSKYFNNSWWPIYKNWYSFTEDWFTPRIEDWKILLKPLKGQKNLRALEIGTFEGRSALWLLENILTAESSILICIDPYPGTLKKAEERFKKNLVRSGYSQKVNLIIDQSEKVLPTFLSEFKNNFDLIYIDGHHEGEQITLDAELSWKLLKTNGIMIFDDYKWPPHQASGISPEIAIDSFIIKYQNQIKILHKDYQVFIEKIA